MLRQTSASWSDLSPKVAAVRTQLSAARVRAPVDGDGVGVKIFTIGSAVRPGEAIIDIAPKAQPMVVEARVRPDDADNARKGQKTEVRFSIQGRSLPIIHGIVNAISADRFEDQRTGQGYFLAEITVSREELARAAAAKGLKSLSLSPGLPAETVIPLRKRSALQFLFEPLTQSLWGAFRQD